MKSYYVSLTGIGESRIEEEEIDTSNLKDNEAIIKAHYSMISAGTELSRAFALKKGFKYPVRPGYCMVGEILEKGEKIKAQKGDLVFVNAPHQSIVRRENRDAVQDQMIISLPQDINEVEATAINLCLVALQGVNLTTVKLNDTVGVFGLGNIGILTALMYQKMGCKVIGLDIVKERCELAKKMGLKTVVSKENQKEEIDYITNNKGLDIAVDVTGISPVIASAIDNTRPYGQVLLLGSPRQSYQTDIMPILSNIHMKNLKVLGGFNKTTPVQPKEGSNDSLIKNFETVCELIKNKDLDISLMINDVVDPKMCQGAYNDLMYRKDKVNCIVFDWTKY